MPIRMLRDWTRSIKILPLSVHAERFFVRLIMKADDYGCYDANPALLKADLFPLLSDKVREADLVRWLAECQKADLIVLYEAGGKKYLQIKDFRQRLDKAKSKYPLPDSTGSLTVVNEFPAETETEYEVETEPENTRATPSSTAPASPPDPIEIFKGLEKNKKSLADFIGAYRPDFVEPYVELWNLFAAERAKAQIVKISDARRKKFRTRIREQSFDFIQILSKAGKAGDFLSTSKWFTWDWIMESDGNYLKVLEGNYDGDTKLLPAPAKISGPPALSKAQSELNYLYQRWLEDPAAVTVFSLDGFHYHELKSDGLMNYQPDQVELIRRMAQHHMAEYQLEGVQAETGLMKKFGVLEFFKTLKANGAAQVYAH